MGRASDKGSYVVAVALLSSAACTDADFYYYVDPTSPLMRASMAANVCAPDDLVEAVPYKILFVVDTSFSNSVTDPKPPGGWPRREQAVRDAIATHISEETVSFGVITFSDAPRRQTYGYIRDPYVLNGAVANIADEQGGTNYSDTLWVVIDFVLNDFNRMDPALALRSHYLIFWLSDGFPTVGVTDPASLIPGVEYLRDSLLGRVAEFQLNTAFLGGGSQPADQVLKAQDLLQRMAVAGLGEFTDIPGGQAFSFDIDPLPLVRRFVFDTLVLNNESARYGVEHPLPDSDMDGVLDQEEASLATNPDERDTDGDGFTDGVEVALTPLLDPLSADAGCVSGELDTDGDGLRDCEELWLGTNPNAADSDGDRLIDSVEFVLGSSPLTNDPSADGDLDRYTDDFEVRAHLAPREFNEPAEADRWAYRYEVVPVVDVGGGLNNCYSISVANVSMYQTHGTKDRPRGQNQLELVVAFVPEGATSPSRFARAYALGRFILPDYREPADGAIVIDSAAFSFLP